MAELGGAVEAVDYMKAALVESHRKRWQRIESGEQVAVGMNRFTSTEPSPLTADADGGILVVDPEVEAEQRAAIERWRADRDQARRRQPRCKSSREVARDDATNIMPATIAAARAGVTTGEWAADAARGVRRVPRSDRGRRGGRGVERGGLRAPRRGRAAQRDARAAPQVPGRQARPRRPLQRRRADRRPRPRRRHGRRLRGHPPHPEPDRQLGRPGGRARDRPVDPVRLAPRADPGGDRRAARGRRRRTCRSWSAGSSPRPTPRPCARPGSPPCTRPKDWNLNGMMRDIIELVAERHGIETAVAGLTQQRPGKRPRPRGKTSRARPERRARRAQPDREPRPRRARAGGGAAGRGLAGGPRPRGARRTSSG